MHEVHMLFFLVDMISRHMERAKAQPVAGRIIQRLEPKGKSLWLAKQVESRENRDTQSSPLRCHHCLLLKAHYQMVLDMKELHLENYIM